jgi:hypothetical protein
MIYCINCNEILPLVVLFLIIEKRIVIVILFFKLIDSFNNFHSHNYFFGIRAFFGMS